MSIRKLSQVPNILFVSYIRYSRREATLDNLVNCEDIYTRRKKKSLLAAS